MADDSNRPTLRASDADRERVADALSGHAAAGRLTVEEHSDRTDAAYAATTLGDLDLLLADLPADPGLIRAEAPVPEEAQVRRGFRGHATQYALVIVVLVVIWALTGAGYFWPVWPALGWGVAIVIDFLRTREEIVEIRSAPADERGAVAARSAGRRRHDGRPGHGHGLPHPPHPPRPPHR